MRAGLSGARSVVLGLLLAALAMAAGCGSSTTGVGPGASTASREVSLRVDGRDRTYLLQPALGGLRHGRAALVVVLHQEGGTLAGIAKETDLSALRAQGASLVYPLGVDHSWDAGACCGLPRRQGVDDVGFLDAVMKDVARRTPVDNRRRAIVGYSSGGMLAYRYVCHRPGVLAAAVMVSGSLESPCEDHLTVPDVLALHGQLDGTVGLTRPIFVSFLGLSPTPLSDTLDTVTRSAGCALKTTEHSATADELRWTGCRGGQVEALLLAHGKHGWGTLGATARTTDFLRGRLLGA